MAVEQAQAIFLGESLVLLLTVTDQGTGDPFDLSTYTAIEFQVKASDGAADPPLISKSLGSGITLVGGGTGGQAQVAINTSDTTTANPEWPAAPGNVGTFRYDLVGIDGSGDRDVLIPPSNFRVKPVVNLP